MNDEVLEKYHRAGEIAAYARDKGLEKILPGRSILEVTDYVESLIYEKGSKPAFPVNVSRNHIAAHFTPLQKDVQVFKEGDLIKLDVGAHIDGYIADTASTIELKTDNHLKLRTAADEALANAIKKMKPGVSLSSIGDIVQKTIQSYGFNPIENLTGHSLNRFRLHSGMSIPSIPTMTLHKKPHIDDVIAIEPFATDGIGRVISGKGSNIYITKSGSQLRGLRDQRSKLQVKKLRNEFNSLPFAHRWCQKFFQNADITMQRLTYLGLVYHYPQLKEQNNGMVSQKEHTVIVTSDGCEITTLGKQ